MSVLAELSVEGPWTYGDLTVTCDQSVPPELGDRFWPVYLEAFSPLRTRAAARHVLERGEFDAEMADTRIWKYVAWTGGEPVGLSTGTAELASVAWISPDFYAEHYPHERDRGALLYLGYSLVRASHRDQRVYLAMLKSMLARPYRLGAVVGWDVCGWNDAERSVGVGLARAVGRLAGATVETVDVQTYYAARFPGSSPSREAADE